MKRSFFILLLLLFVQAISAQSLKSIEDRLCEPFSKIGYYDTARYNNDAYEDSLENTNKDFEKLLLHYTKTNPETITYEFKNLISNRGITIVTSEDDLFRIYSWDTRECGTCRAFNVVFQYKDKRGLHSFPATFNKDQDPPDNGYSFFQIDDIIIKGKTFYIVQSRSVGSSALYAYRINIFTINNDSLTDRTNLFKAGGKFLSDIGYWYDLSWYNANAKGNETMRNADLEIHYNKERQIISIPLTGNDGIYRGRIRYKFNGNYFEKI